MVEPRLDVLQRDFHVNKLKFTKPAIICGSSCFNQLLVKEEVPSVESNAIEQEQRDFAEAIRTGRETARHRRRWPRCGRRSPDGACISP